MIVLDASALIAWAQSEDAHHKEARRLLVKYADDDLGASPITLAEFYVAPARKGLLDVARRHVADLGVETIPLPPTADSQLAVLRSESGLKMPDCCVLLAATQRDAEVMTFDDRVRSVATERGVAIAD